MHLQKASRLGLYAVLLMASVPKDLVTASMIAEAYGVSENHVAKVLQQLARAGIVRGVRGASGGYQLAITPKELTMFDVVRVLEGELTPTCFGCDAVGPENSPNCAVYESCPIRGVMEEIAEHTYYTLRSVTIAALVAAEGRAATARRALRDSPGAKSPR
ncbi:MAG: Rrf2 family transcriptional regulator [Myxococcota bacterium]